MSNTKAAIHEVVYNCFLESNRPYSVNDVAHKLPEGYSKSAVQGAIEQLLKNAKLTEKTYGKEKIYALNQVLLPTSTDQELKSMDVKIAALAADVKSEEEAFKNAETDLKSLSGARSFEEITKELEMATFELKSLEERLATFSDAPAKVTQNDRDRIMRNYNTMLREWRRRKRLCMDIIDAVLEGYPKTKKALMEEAGIETDENVGVAIPK